MQDRVRKWSPGQLGIAALLLATALLAALPVMDRQAQGTYEPLFQRALVTFALARTLNGVISAVQGTELALQPAGVGVTLTPGEILDPVNDLVERFSWIMLGATVSLGIQSVLMDFSSWWAVKALAVVMSLWLLVAYLGQAGDGKRFQVLMRFFLIVLFLRFAVPLTLLANEALYRLFLEPRYQQSTEVVSLAGDEIEHLGSGEDASAGSPGPGIGGMFESLGQAMDRTREALEFGEKVERIKARAAEIVQHLIQLSVVFIIQTGILPLAFLWIFLQLAKRVFRPVKS